MTVQDKFRVVFELIANIVILRCPLLLGFRPIITLNRVTPGIDTPGTAYVRVVAVLNNRRFLHVTPLIVRISHCFGTSGRLVVVGDLIEDFLHVVDVIQISIGGFERDFDR